MAIDFRPPTRPQPNRGSPPGKKIHLPLFIKQREPNQEPYLTEQLRIRHICPYQSAHGKVHHTRALARAWRVRTPLLACRSLSTVPWTTKPSTTPEGRGPYALYLREVKPIEREHRQFELLVSLLKIYKEATGHVAIPYGFAIPCDEELAHRRKAAHNGHVCGLVGDVSEIEWPEHARAFNVGRVLDKFLVNSDYQLRYPSILSQLRELGFDGTRREYEWKHQTLAALQGYFDRYGHSLVPTTFEVPRHDASWPMATRGLQLGERVHTIRGKSFMLSDEERVDLQRVDFSFDVSETMWSDDILPSLETFRRLHGHCNVSQAFVIPSDDEWARKAWGLLLGVTVNNIRSQGEYADQVSRDASRLREIGFVWHHNDHQWNEGVLPALETFHEINGHCRVPQSFVVPSSGEWPNQAWGMKLGFTVNNMRSQGYFAAQVKRDRDRLAAIGFSWDPKQDKWDEILLPAFEKFYEIHGHCRIKRSFVVPENLHWPQSTWGLKLGRALNEITYRGYYAEQRKKDDARLAATEFPERNQ